ncbi:hypothetical protein C1646_777728 [Rhizophagus diaphanus]|nr:hypothetical protein C1646_777728 [Rhizophagus diaphanus] [Rhizophagus sp. MUCL 43196]
MDKDFVANAMADTSLDGTNTTTTSQQNNSHSTSQENTQAPPPPPPSPNNSTALTTPSHNASFGVDTGQSPNQAADPTPTITIICQDY